MNKNELRKHIESLKDIQEEFDLIEKDYKYGNNQNIRNNAEKDLELKILHFKVYVQRYNELFEYIFPNHADDQKRAIIWDYFLNISHFKMELEDLINNLESNLKEN